MIALSGERVWINGAQKIRDNKLTVFDCSFGNVLIVALEGKV
jgi:hypothetical protein